MADVGFGDFSNAFATSFSSIGGYEEAKTLLELFKEFLGIDPEDTTHDEALTKALNMAGDAVERYLDRIVAKRSVTEYFAHHFGTVELHNPQVDVSVAPVVTLNGDVTTGWSVYIYRGKTGFLTRTGHNWNAPMDWSRFDQVDVSYTAGFDPIPSDLANALIYTAAEFYASEGTGIAPGGASGDVKSMTVFDVGAVSYDVGSSSSSGSGSWPANDLGVIPSSAEGLLSAYKRMSC